MGDNNDAVKIYYSHAMPLYGTKLEVLEKKQILDNLPKAELVDPGSYQSNPEKMKGGMEYCYKLIEECNTLIFTRFLGKITAGVGKEINYALKEKMPVHELRKGKLIKIAKPVNYLSREQTVRFYRIVRTIRLLSRK